MIHPKVVITGGSGFIGTNAVSHFLRLGWQVLSLDIRAPQETTHHDCWRACDIRDPLPYQALVRRFAPDYVIHLAARTDLLEARDPRRYVANIEGVANTVGAVQACPSIRRVIFASSRMVCRIGYTPLSDEDYCPPNPYGESKRLGELIVRGAKLETDWVLLRPTSIWGPWFDVPYRLFFDSIRRGTYWHPGRHDPLKSFGFVGNTVVQLERVLAAPAADIAGKTIYLCDYPALRLSDWAEEIRAAMGVRPIKRAPFAMLQTLALVGDVLSAAGWYRVPLSTSRLSNLVASMAFDTACLEQVCGPLPHTMKSGVEHTVQWMGAARRGSK